MTDSASPGVSIFITWVVNYDDRFSLEVSMSRLSPLPVCKKGKYKCTDFYDGVVVRESDIDV